MNISVPSHTVRAAFCARGLDHPQSNIPVYGLIAAGLEYINHANARGQRRR
jgi:predicted porin